MFTSLGYVMQIHIGQQVIRDLIYGLTPKPLPKCCNEDYSTMGDLKYIGGKFDWNQSIFIQ